MFILDFVAILLTYMFDKPVILVGMMYSIPLFSTHHYQRPLVAGRIIGDLVVLMLCIYFLDQSIWFVIVAIIAALLWARLSRWGYKRYSPVYQGYKSLKIQAQNSNLIHICDYGDYMRCLDKPYHKYLGRDLLTFVTKDDSRLYYKIMSCQGYVQYEGRFEVKDQPLNAESILKVVSCHGISIDMGDVNMMFPDHYRIKVKCHTPKMKRWILIQDDQHLAALRASLGDGQSSDL